MAASKKLQKEREEWVQAVRELCDTISAWCQSIGWPVREEVKTITEKELGTYEAPALIVDCPDGEIRVDPIARRVIRAEGRVDLLSYPTLHRMMLLRIHGQWTVKTDSGINWPQPWNESTFVNLAQEMISAA